MSGLPPDMLDRMTDREYEEYRADMKRSRELNATPPERLSSWVSYLPAVLVVLVTLFVWFVL